MEPTGEDQVIYFVKGLQKEGVISAQLHFSPPLKLSNFEI